MFSWNILHSAGFLSLKHPKKSLLKNCCSFLEREYHVERTWNPKTTREKHVCLLLAANVQHIVSIGKKIVTNHRQNKQRIRYIYQWHGTKNTPKQNGPMQHSPSKLTERKALFHTIMFKGQTAGFLRIISGTLKPSAVWPIGGWRCMNYLGSLQNAIKQTYLMPKHWHDTKKAQRKCSYIYIYIETKWNM